MQLQPNNEQDSQKQEYYDSLIKETKPRLNKYKQVVVIVSIAVFMIIAYLVYSYWMRPSVAHFTSIVIGAQFYSLYGALLLSLGAIAKPYTLALMSMTITGCNADLFTALMKSRFTARIGISFVVFGFLVSGIVMLLNEIITI